MRQSGSPPPWLLSAVCLLFFGSGLAALAYQVVWLRSLSLVFGVTVHAAATVLAGFMAGLAVGSAVAGRLTLTPRQSLLFFAVAEAGVGVTAVLAAPLLSALARGYQVLGPSLPDSLALLTAWRFAVAALVLIVPTSLMGATLPLLVRATAADARIGTRLGLLYATNTAGAIAGALVTGFWLVAELGLQRTAWLAGAVNAVIAILAIGVSRMVPASGAPDQVAVEAGTADVVEVDAASRRTIAVVFAMSGLVSLALEVIWFRILAVHLRPTAYAFTIMLAAVLGGIAVGSYAVAPWFGRRRPWLPVLAVLQLGVALVAVLSLNPIPAVGRLQALLGPVYGAAGIPEYVWSLVTTSLVSIVPTSLLLGAAFPIGLRLYVGGSGPDASRHVATFYSLNVCGAIAGSVVAGFVLLPVLGSRGALIAVCSVALASSLLLAYRLWARWPNIAGFLSIVGPVAFLMAALNSADAFADFVRLNPRSGRVLWHAEGVQTTVSVQQQRGGAKVLYLDGMHQADDSRASRFTHHSIGALPMMLHPNPRKVLVIGLGGGATPGATAMFPSAAVDVVELSSEVVTAARYFGHINFDLFTRPNVQLRVDDGRNFLMTTATRYDVVMADAILPSRNGATNLYSKEYFALARRVLAPGGVVLQWLGSDDAFEYKLILRTFLSVFPDTTLWGGHSLMLGTTSPFSLSRKAFTRRREDPRFRAVFDLPIDRLAAWYSAGPAALAAFVGPGPLLSDDRPLPEYFLSMPARTPRDLSTLTGSFDEVLRP